MVPDILEAGNEALCSSKKCWCDGCAIQLARELSCAKYLYEYLNYRSNSAFRNRFVEGNHTGRKCGSLVEGYCASLLLTTLSHPGCKQLMQYIYVYIFGFLASRLRSRSLPNFTVLPRFVRHVNLRAHLKALLGCNFFHWSST